MKKLIMLIITTIVLTGCYQMIDIATNKNPRVTFLNAFEYDAVNIEKLPVVKSQYFKILHAGFIVQPNKENNFKTSEIVAFAHLQQIKKFKQDVYEEVIFDNPNTPTKPIIFNGEYTTDSKLSRVVSSHLANIKIGQAYKVVINFYADKDKTKLLDTLTQELVSPYDTRGACLKSKFPIKNDLESFLGNKNQCIKIW